MDGPQEASGVLAKLIPPTHCREAPLTPTAARAQQRFRALRARRQATGLAKLVAQLAGARTRNRRAA